MHISLQENGLMHPDCSYTRREVKNKISSCGSQEGNCICLTQQEAFHYLPNGLGHLVALASPCASCPLPGCELQIRKPTPLRAIESWEKKQPNLWVIFSMVCEGNKAFTCVSDSFLQETKQVKEKSLNFSVTVKAGLFKDQAFLCLYFPSN